MKEIIVSSKGQIVIPQNLREKFEIIKGTKLKVIEDEGTIKLIPPVRTTSLCGTWDLDKRKIEKEISEGRDKWR